MHNEHEGSLDPRFTGASGKLWGGRFAKRTAEVVERYTASIPFDVRLASQDIRGSIAHVRMLARTGLLTAEEARLLEEGLREIEASIRRGEVRWTYADEDVHMWVERLLRERVGPVAGKLHTGRSRNDQVATDLHLYVRDEAARARSMLADVRRALLDLADAHRDVVLPGYTHLQRAQPVTLAHHLLAYFWMFSRDAERLVDLDRRASWSPLGAGALAGSRFPFDRFFTAAELGLSAVYPNSLDAVSDRDFVLEFVFALSLIAVHLSRLAEELILWSSQEFAFVELDDAFATGSSMMPQKKNPDVPELLRGKTGRVVGDLVALLTVLKGLPLAYNKDLQEDKEALFDAVDTVLAGLEVTAPLLRSLSFRADAMRRAADDPLLCATDLAEALALRGVPFREAHEAVGRLVAYALAAGKSLRDLTPEELLRHHAAFRPEDLELLSPESAVAGRKLFGGPASEAVAEQIALARRILEEEPLGRTVSDVLRAFAEGGERGGEPGR
ncbi:MAG: argininosuccinate lyase [Brockia lithotrophica]|nr:argininosuccinate lyase [Brockia lithotrophica]